MSILAGAAAALTSAFMSAHPRVVQEQLKRARALDRLGRDGEARLAYLHVLRHDSGHVGALTDLARILIREGNHAAALTALERAAELHPRSASAHANVATLLANIDAKAARSRYELALTLDPQSLPAQRGLAVLLLRAGDVAHAHRIGVAGFRRSPDCWPFRGEGRGVAILWIQSALGGNVPVERLLDDHVFGRVSLAAEFFDPADAGPLPAHDVVFNAVGDADLCRESLGAVEAVLARTSAPVINPPRAIRPSGRRDNAERLGAIRGVVAPRVVELSRAALGAPGAARELVESGFVWPLLLRSPGFHTGENFVKVDGPEALPGALDALPGETLLALQFLDTRGQDGLFRKYRVMFIDGALYPLHLAVSRDWKVHYFSSDMAENEAHRREEAAFLEDMPRALGTAAMAALERVRAMLGLDYGGVDFGVDAEGHVVVFESNATMLIAEPGVDPQWAYRVAPVERASRAVVRMLLRRAGREVAA